MDARTYIKIRGANENNLKNIDVDIPPKRAGGAHRAQWFGEIVSCF